MTDRWLTIAQFAETVQICEATYFKLKRQGLGPEETRFGNVVRISPDALCEWRPRMREMQATKAARPEADRRTAHSRAAGKLAAASPRHVTNHKREEVPRKSPLRRARAACAKRVVAPATRRLSAAHGAGTPRNGGL